MSERPAPSLLVFDITWVVPLCLGVYTADDIYEVCWRFTLSLDVKALQQSDCRGLRRGMISDDSQPEFSESNFYSFRRHCNSPGSSIATAHALWDLEPEGDTLLSWNPKTILRWVSGPPVSRTSFPLLQRKDRDPTCKRKHLDTTTDDGCNGQHHNNSTWRRHQRLSWLVVRSCARYLRGQHVPRSDLFSVFSSSCWYVVRMVLFCCVLLMV